MYLVYFFVCNRHFVLRRRTEVKTEIGNETGKIVSGVAPWPELPYSKQTPLLERPGFRAWAVICLWESFGRVVTLDLLKKIGVKQIAVQETSSRRRRRRREALPEIPRKEH